MCPAGKATRALLPFFENALTSFLNTSSTSNGDRFRIVRTISHTRPSIKSSFPSFSSTSPTHLPDSREFTRIRLSSGRPLLILDSSFNPPNTAHASLVYAALDWEQKHYGLTRQEEANAGTDQIVSNVLLLFSVQNADKEASLTEFLNRLAMMHLLALDIASYMPNSRPVDIHLCLACDPFYVDKAKAISRYLNEISASQDGPQQIYAMGYDTLVRFLHPKYYLSLNAGAPLSALAPFFDEGGSILAMHRPAQQASAALQNDTLPLEKYLSQLKEGHLSDQGLSPAWVSKIYGIPAVDSTQGVSSTVVRRASHGLWARGESAKDAWDATLVDEGICTASVAEWIRQNGLYR